MRKIQGTIREIRNKTEEELWGVAREIEAPYELVKQTAELGKLPVVNFAAGGVATPADAALMMQLGADGVFVGSGISKSEKPEIVAKAITEATANYEDAEVLAKVSRGLGKAMPGLEISQIPEEERLQTRGW
jgi:pyridoxal 5'-phosphate synthase pdxS subunit